MKQSTDYKRIVSELMKSDKKDLHILADFDRTFTYGSIDGAKTPSIISMLRDGNHLSEEYAKTAHSFYDKYAPIEKDLSIPLSERKDAMNEWWDSHHQLLIKENLSYKDIEDIVQNGDVKLRDGVSDFLELLSQNNIPLVIMSASGCGDAIPMYFDEIGKDYPNIYYITNRFNWNDEGIATSIQGSAIHSLNKDETVIRDFPDIFTVIENKRNVILLGDSLGDVNMIDGFDYDNLLKIGFLNIDYEENVDKFGENFDLVLDGDSGFEPITNIINEIV